MSDMKKMELTEEWKVYLGEWDKELDRMEEELSKKGIPLASEVAQREHFPEWYEVMKSIQDVVGAEDKLPEGEWVLLHPGFEQTDATEENYFMVSGSLNPQIGIFGRPKAVNYLLSLFQKGELTLLFGLPILTDKKGRNLFVEMLLLHASSFEWPKHKLGVYRPSKGVKYRQRPQFHCKIVNDSKLVEFEYPHYEFESVRFRVSIDRESTPALPVGRIAKAIKDFYLSSERIEWLHSSEALEKKYTERKELDVIELE